MNQRDSLQKHTIIALVEDRPGVLNRIASKWRQRGFNIESLAVGHSETPGLSRMTFVVDATTDAEQVVKQVDKLIEVVSIRDLSAEEIVSRELALI
jgi:acetolactate synthase-1/3 small subunit